MIKSTPADAGDVGEEGLIPGSGSALGAGNGYPLQYACLENPPGRRLWQATVRAVSESDVTELACAVNLRCCAGFRNSAT